MKYRIVCTPTPGYDDNKPTNMGRKSFDARFPFPVGSLTDVSSFRAMIVRTNIASDLIVQVGDSIFHLHKLPVVSKVNT
ncbi:hypothetical protein LWI29_006042 [Acer saccharum]|uniref:Uncharacterized protein n=1 Tax=Acer saccharum TaxID=4024 RepID=A0AA39T1D9_ACESA|nr:hypothetical protein LWI29_006042 [Acer saccharum]